MPKPIIRSPKPDVASLPVPGVPWWNSPFRSQLIKATTLLAGGQSLKAALIARDLVRLMEDRSADRDDLKPVLRLAADAWRNTAARFATHSADYLSTTRQHMRVDFLAEARAAYMQVLDIANVVRMSRAMADAYVALKRYVEAAQILEEALEVALKQEVLEVVEALPFLRQMGEATQLVFEKYSTRHYPSFLEEGPRAAGYLYIADDPARAMAYMQTVAERYHHAAQVYHRLGRHGEAIDILLQGVVIDVVLGKDEAVTARADQIVQYAILAGDKQALASYDRALQFSQNGATAVGQAIIQDQAQVVIVKNKVSLNAIQEFHKAADNSMDYVSRLTGNSYYGRHLNDERALRELWVNMAIAFRQGMAWTQTLEMLKPYQFSSLVRQFASHGIGMMRYSHVVHTGNLTSASALYPSSPDFVRADPKLLQLLGRIGGGGMLDMSVLAPYLARQLECSPAEIEAAFTIYGDSRLIGRLKAMMGEVAFAQVHQEILTHHHQSLREVWKK